MSRYLREWPRRPSQAWRTFLANQFGQFTFISQVMSPCTSGDDVVDASVAPLRSNSVDRPTVCVESMRVFAWSPVGTFYVVIRDRSEYWRTTAFDEQLDLPEIVPKTCGDIVANHSGAGIRLRSPLRPEQPAI